MKTIRIIALALFAGAFIGCAGEGDAKQENDNEAVKAVTQEGHEEHGEHAHYACPMDCEKGKVYEEPGTCPVCKMDLVEVAETETDTNQTHDHEHGFACPMHPEITGHEGDKCSECGMDLEE